MPGPSVDGLILRSLEEALGKKISRIDRMNRILLMIGIHVE